MTKVNFDNVGFVYKFWYFVFCYIETALPFSILRKYFFKKTKNLPDKWVVFNTLFSFTTIILIHNNIIDNVGKAILIYASIRIFEIVVYQINVLIFHPYKALVMHGKKEYRIQNPYRSVVLLGHNLIEVVFWFTALTIYLGSNDYGILHNLAENTIRIFTLNYEKLSSNQSILQMVFFVEVLCGMILTIISLAKFIGELPHVHLELEDQEKINR